MTTGHTPGRKTVDSRKVYHSSRLHIQEDDDYLEFLVKFNIDLKLVGIDLPSFVEKLDSFVLELYHRGYPSARINKCIGRILNKIKFGCESYRVMRRVKR